MHPYPLLAAVCYHRPRCEREQCVRGLICGADHFTIGWMYYVVWSDHYEGPIHGSLLRRSRL